MNQLGCVGSGNKSQRQKKGPWSLGVRKAKIKHPGKQEGQGKAWHDSWAGEDLHTRPGSLEKEIPTTCAFSFFFAHLGMVKRRGQESLRCAPKRESAAPFWKKQKQKQILYKTVNLKQLMKYHILRTGFLYLYSRLLKKQIVICNLTSFPLLFYQCTPVHNLIHRLQFHCSFVIYVSP